MLLAVSGPCLTHAHSSSRLKRFPLTCFPSAANDDDGDVGDGDNDAAAAAAMMVRLRMSTRDACGSN